MYIYIYNHFIIANTCCGPANNSKYFLLNSDLIMTKIYMKL